MISLYIYITIKLREIIKFNFFNILNSSLINKIEKEDLTKSNQLDFLTETNYSKIVEYSILMS